MSARIDLTGKRSGRLVALSLDGGRYWRYRCDCGVEFVAHSGNVQAGKTRSCGCYCRELTTAMNKAKRTHGLSASKLYRAWSAMKQRCGNPKHQVYARYGGRGIAVCERWASSSAAFIDDMRESYERHVAEHGARRTTLDRIDNEGNYEPANCRWATPNVQQNNRRHKDRLGRNTGSRA